MLIREMRPEEKPRERFKESAGDVSITDLIAILIRTGRKNHSVREVASDVVSFLEENCGEAWIEEPYWKDLTDIPGIGADKAVTICAAIELGRRLAGRFRKRELPDFNAPDRVASYFMEMLRHESQEYLYACYVNTKNRLMGKKEIGRGNMNAAPADIKEIMRWAIRLKARGIILVHNHGFAVKNAKNIDKY
ncbi:JAB domain-containing protein [Allisonella histaminiformans]|uniref:JAB domain-containing protein n=1 Tax=Allisonella histaminiformans TaxID=209880 RepID=UPI002E75B24F|nr:JAB domain-containing protein [Allisonella histaminiformans]